MMLLMMLLFVACQAVWKRLNRPKLVRHPDCQALATACKTAALCEILQKGQSPTELPFHCWNHKSFEVITELHLYSVCDPPPAWHDQALLKHRRVRKMHSACAIERNWKRLFALSRAVCIAKSTRGNWGKSINFYHFIPNSYMFTASLNGAAEFVFQSVGGF